MKFPDSLRYSKEHEWVKNENGTVVIGISEFAQDELGDIVFVELPEPGKVLDVNDTFGVAESVKTVSDLFCPVSGEVVEINTVLEDKPEQVNQSPYDMGWMIKIKLSDPAQLEGLMTAGEYKAYVESNK